MESFNAVELRELRGAGGRPGVSPTPPTAGCAARGFENASYQQDEDQDEEQGRQQGPTVSAGGPASTLANRKVRLVSVNLRLNKWV